MAQFGVWPDSTRPISRISWKRSRQTARANEIMHENSKDLTAQQIREVTTYLATR
jgi:hypothetical protein